LTSASDAGSDTGADGWEVDVLADDSTETDD